MSSFTALETPAGAKDEKSKCGDVSGAGPAPGGHSPSSLEEKLSLIERFLRCLEGVSPAACGSILELRQRLAAGRLHLAVLGQFKRGKSTLLNALIGKELLPTSVVPLTAVPTFLRFGEASGVRTSFIDGRPAEQSQGVDINELRSRLAELVTEAGNARNRLGVSQVEVFVPSPLLARGVVLIDTPGIGSTLRHNTEATLGFLPQCDAALFVLSADPPITEAEAGFLATVREKVHRLFFVLNKVDYLSASERVQAEQFIRTVLVQKAGVDPGVPLFPVSARWGMDAREKNDTGLWEASGLKAMEEHLISFLGREKRETLGQAVRARASAILEETAAGLELSVHSWQLPLEDLERKAAVFAEKAQELRREMTRSEDILNGDRERLKRKLEDHGEELRERARGYFTAVLDEEAGKAADVTEERLQSALAQAIPGFFEHEMAAATERFRMAVEDVLETHRRRAEELVAVLRATATELFDVPIGGGNGEEALQIFEEPYWVTHSWDTSLHALSPDAINRTLRGPRRNARVLRRLANQVEQMVIRNVENLRWSVLQSLERSFLMHVPMVRGRLTEILEAAERALGQTLQKRRDTKEISAGELDRLQHALQETRRHQEMLSDSPR